MRTVVKEFAVYNYDELSEKARATVKQLYLDNPMRNDEFYEMCMDRLNSMFPNSDLNVHYSLTYCQGDGLNIEGTVLFKEVLPELKDFSKEEHETLEKYLKHLHGEFEFEKNRHYSYSCKFIDKKYVESYAETATETLKDEFEVVNIPLLIKFFELMFDYFETLDKEFETMGYEYLYEVNEEELRDWCEENGYEFTSDGKLF